MGLKKGKVYKIEWYIVRGKVEVFINKRIFLYPLCLFRISKKIYCPYDTISAFNKNWEKV